MILFIKEEIYYYGRLFCFVTSRPWLFRVLPCFVTFSALTFQDTFNTLLLKAYSLKIDDTGICRFFERRLNCCCLTNSTWKLWGTLFMIIFVLAGLSSLAKRLRCKPALSGPRAEPQFRDGPQMDGGRNMQTWVDLIPRFGLATPRT